MYLLYININDKISKNCINDHGTIREYLLKLWNFLGDNQEIFILFFFSFRLSNFYLISIYYVDSERDNL